MANANPFSSSQLYQKISTPSLNILDALASIVKETSWDISAVTGPQLGTVAAARIPAKPFIVGFIPPDVVVNFVPLTKNQSTLVTIPVTSTPTSSSGSQLTGGQNPLTPTPLTPAQAMGALLAAGCPQSALLIVAAQSAAETNLWGSGKGKIGQGFNNYNFGNITPTSKQVANGTSYFVVHFSPTASGKFVSYPDASSGAAGMVNFLQNNGTLAAAGDINSYMAHLQATNYLGQVGLIGIDGKPITQQDYTNYQTNIQSLIGQLRGVTPVPPPDPNATPAEFGSATTQPASTPPNATPVATTSIMTNAINITDPNSGDPLAAAMGRSVSVFDGTRAESVQKQTNYLNQQILAIQQAPALMMLVNPSEFNRSYEHTVDPVKTRSGYVVNMWLERPLVISAKGVTAGQYVFQSDGGGGISALNRIYSVSYQNLMSLVEMFKNNGNIFTDNSFGDGNAGIPLISLSIYIYYDGHVYIGSFDDFEITDDGNKPYNLSYTWKFTVRYDIDTSGIANTIINNGLAYGASAARSGF
jgi:hypothetical protein